MAAQETRNDLGKTAPLPALREEHLEETELLEFSHNLLEPARRRGVVEHLDACPRCREVLSAMHAEDVGGATKLSDPLIGQTLGEYKVEQALSRGGMGAVYRGVHPVIGKQVAVKVLLPDMAEDPDSMHRLLAEARAVNAIRHPNIIDIFSFGSLPDGRQYFVMELLDGQPLNEVLVERGRLSATDVITVLDQAMAALGAAHAASVVHRDLKPANLFVTTLPNQGWHVTVLDFGLAKRLGASASTAPNLVMGTPGYMAPEQIRGQQVTPATDLYAMGVVAWVLLTGQEPFRGDSFVDLMMKHLEEPLPSLRALAPDCPPDLAALVERLLEKRPEARPRSALEVQGELARLRRSVEGRETLRAPRPLMPLDELVKPEQRPNIPTLGTAPAPPRDAEAKAAPQPPTRSSAPPEATTRPVALIPTSQPAPTRLVKPEPSTRSRERSSVPLDSSMRPLEASSAPRGLVVGGAVLVLAGLGLLGWRLASTNAEPLARREQAPPVAALPVKVAEPVAAAVPPVAVGPVPTSPPTTGAAPPEPTPPEPTPAEPTPAGPTPAGPVVVPPKQGPAVGANASRLRGRVDKARADAARLTSSAARRMMNLDLDRVEARLKRGDDPRAISRELDDILDNYGAR